MLEIKKSAGKLLSNIELFDVYKLDDKKSLAYNLTFTDKDNTLKIEDIMPIFEKIMQDVKDKFKCEVRDK